MKFLPMNDQDREEFMNLHAPLGEPGSGRVRYAAAMYFHGQGQMTDEHLEAYRICAKDDRADPHLLMSGSSQ